MNREIKLEYGFQSVNGIVKKKYYLHEIPNIKEKCDVWNDLPIVYFREYTGLKDKNNTGKEIYESDIFEVVFKDCPDGYSIMGRETTVKIIKGVVVFNFGMFCIKFLHPDTNEYAYFPLHKFIENDEKIVIGNLYENPELIKN